MYEEERSRCCGINSQQGRAWMFKNHAGWAAGPLKPSTRASNTTNLCLIAVEIGDDERPRLLYCMSRIYFRLREKIKQSLLGKDHICAANLGFAFIVQQGRAI